MKKTIILLLTALSVPLLVNGQNTLRPNIYVGDMNYYNTAAGLGNTQNNNMVSVYGKHKLEDNELWDKNPNIYANFVSRMDGSNSIYSASYIYDNYSFYDRHAVYAGYTSHQKIGGNDDHSISFGARAILNFDRIKWDKQALVPDKSGSDTYFTPDLDMGIMYRRNKLTAGVAVKNVFANTKEVDDTDLLKNQREWYVNASYRFDPTQNISLTPYTLLMLDRKFSFDLGLHSSFYQFVEASYHFRLEGTRNVGILGLNLSKNLKLNAAIDYSFIHDDRNIEAQIAYRFK